LKPHFEEELEEAKAKKTGQKSKRRSRKSNDFSDPPVSKKEPDPDNFVVVDGTGKTIFILALPAPHSSAGSHSILINIRFPKPTSRVLHDE